MSAPPRSACPSRCPSQVTAEQLRARGNALFQAGDHAAALAAYTEALGLCDSGPERAVLHRNRAACHLRLTTPRQRLMHLKPLKLTAGT